MTQLQQQPAAGNSTGKIVAIGCGVVLVLAVGAVILIYFSLKKAVLGYVEEFTSTEAVQLADPEGSEADAQIVIARFDEFVNALENGTDTDPLSLDENEINQLIFYHPKWKQLSDRVRIAIEAEKISGQVSLPLDDLGKLLDALKGRYLNGSATFTIGLTGGRLVVFLESLEVNEKSVPAEIMSQLKAENLAEDANTDPDFQKMTESLQSIAVENGKLIITPKPAGQRSPPEPAP